ncbi:MAG: NADH-quinone oxidoreductase subunit A, partial [Paracoccaceae bacterium]
MENLLMEYLPILIFLGICLGLALVLMLSAAILAP